MTTIPWLHRLGRSRLSGVPVAVLLGMLIGAVPAGTQTPPPELLPLDELSPGFLGMYRKVMEIEEEIRRHTERYGVDFDLARAVCLYESGGNAGLASSAGAQGYFQVMPATFRLLKVPTNIEAGVKYLSQMIRQFEREDRAVAAYNAGPGAVGRRGGLPLETLQYVIGVGGYRTVLKLHEPSIRYYASRLRLATVQPGDGWSALAARLGVPEWDLRLYNPFLASRPLRPGQVVAYPPEAPAQLLRPVAGGAEYRMRHGDHYIKLAFALGIDLDPLRKANGLWHLQTVPAGAVLRIPFEADRLQLVRAALGQAPAPLVAAAAPAPSPAAPPATNVLHRVARGDTLVALARRYGTSVRAIQEANSLRRTMIRVGQSLTIPLAADVEMIAGQDAGSRD